ncbi:hypothetical protein C5O19_11400 [Siphonobacter curvatus]|uniref:Uncharacterized protein n=1 Tax=Siphonobacter curvatus TaxID=2094562 RepID=A0A2S7IR44_9BACT|nr:hypothetical protein C5O19_11400 [Siphonobacter curvatus]
MVKQYAYELWVFQVSESYQNGNGDWLEGTSEWVNVSKCRDESNSKGQSINLVDGSSYRFESLIQLPKKAPKVEAGTRVEVRDGSEVRLSATVKRFSKDQLHSRIWV